MRFLATLRLLLLMAPLSGCASSNLPWVELNGQRFQVEVARDDAARARGLMFRDSLPADHGMLFVFERAEPQAFWMRNTRIPLDILYFDAQRKLVSIAAGVPPCTTPHCPSYPSEGAAQYTLELNAGMARKLGTQRGDELKLDPQIRIPEGS
jgi:uncharacterized protein